MSLGALAARRTAALRAAAAARRRGPPPACGAVAPPWRRGCARGCTATTAPAAPQGEAPARAKESYGWCQTLSTEEYALAIPPRDFIQALRVDNAQPEELMRVFRRIDADASGALSASELRALMAQVKGSSCSEEELEYAVQLLLCKYDHGRDGELCYAEFEAAVHALASQVDRRAYALAATIGVAFMGFSVMFPMGPPLVQAFGLSQLQFGTLTTVFAVGKLSGNIPSSILAEQYGRKPLLIGGLLAVGVGIGGIMFATCYEHLLLLRLAIGLGVASTFTAAGMYITDISHSLNSARTRAPMQMGMAAGMLIGPAFGGVLMEHIGFQLTALGVGAATFATALAASVLLPETLQRQATERPQAGIRDILKSWGPVLEDARLRMILSWGWCYNGAFWGATALLPLIYVDLALTPSVVGSISTVNAAVSLVATPLVASMADHFGKMSVVVPGALVYGGSLILIPQAGSLLELLPVLAAMQIGGAMCSQAQVYAMDCVPARDRAKVPGLWNTVGDTGMVASSFASAVVAQMLTTGTAFCADGVLLLTATTLMLGLLARSR